MKTLHLPEVVCTVRWTAPSDKPAFSQEIDRGSLPDPHGSKLKTALYFVHVEFVFDYLQYVDGFEQKIRGSLELLLSRLGASGSVTTGISRFTIVELEIVDGSVRVIVGIIVSAAFAIVVNYPALKEHSALIVEDIAPHVRMLVEYYDGIGVDETKGNLDVPSQCYEGIDTRLFESPYIGADDTSLYDDDLDDPDDGPTGPKM